ncbi:hypothetical protein ACQP2Y_21940 [Actinoplanes sp. CA-051413]|uniref:hypothetical protein n=1 Tax=Actinoplanes sp. CA-051413 TaxID=3239899 RepID=UPI003D99609F
MTFDGVSVEDVAAALQLFGVLDWLLASLTFAFVLGVCLLVVGAVGIVWSRISHARQAAADESAPAGVE